MNKLVPRSLTQLQKKAMLGHLGCLFFFLVFLFQAALPLAAQEYQVFFGDLHGHSTLSFDANSTAKTPSAAFAHARDVANLDFYAITDHGNVRTSSPSGQHDDTVISLALALWHRKQSARRKHYSYQLP